MSKPEDICLNCINKIDLVLTTTDPYAYSYKRNGVCYNRESYCKLTGKRLFSFVEIVKCTGFEEKCKKKNHH